MNNPGDNSPGEEPLASRLRDALNAEAAMVSPSDDGLARIRAATTESGRPWWRHPAVVAVAAAAVLGGAVAGAVVALTGESDGDTVVASDPSDDTPESDSPGPGDTSAPSPSSSFIEGNVYVYYVHDDGQALRLYREERPNIGAEPVTAAILTMLREAALDPDYGSPWPRSTQLVDYSVDGDLATVDLSDFPSTGGLAEKLGVQQLVHTVTANDNSVQQVRLLVNGTTPPSGEADWSEPVAREPMVDVQGLIWLLGPTQSEKVSSPVEIDGYGTAFEGTISWEVRRDGAGEVVAEGFTQAGSNGEFGEFRDTVELAPGAYEIRAFESSAEDTAPLHVDTKTFTVG